MRERIFHLLQKAAPDDRLSHIYDVFIVAVAFISLLPLMFKEETPLLYNIDIITVYILFADYVLRWITNDFKTGKKGVRPFVEYPFTPFAVIDLLSLLPSLGVVNHSFRILRVLRVFKILHYSDNFLYIVRVFNKERKTLLSVLYIALFYIFVSALAMFANEPETFDSFFEATYWATTALTTVGYGDVYPATAFGRLISMISSLFGIAIIALPAGIVTAGFVDEINRAKEEKETALSSPKKEAPTHRLNSSIIKKYVYIMVFCIMLNQGLQLISEKLGLPLWLDFAGTALAAIVLEPGAGLIVGLVDNFILSLEYGPRALLYYCISAAIAVIAGVMLSNSQKITVKKICAAMALIIIISPLLSTLVGFAILGLPSPVGRWEQAIFTIAAEAGVPNALSYFCGVFVIKIFDTLAAALFVAAGIRFLKPWAASTPPDIL